MTGGRPGSPRRAPVPGTVAAFLKVALAVVEAFGACSRPVERRPGRASCQGVCSLARRAWHAERPQVFGARRPKRPTNTATFCDWHPCQRPMTRIHIRIGCRHAKSGLRICRIELMQLVVPNFRCTEAAVIYNCSRNPGQSANNHRQMICTPPRSSTRPPAIARIRRPGAWPMVNRMRWRAPLHQGTFSIPVSLGSAARRPVGA